jgi:SAM-dependent methyltransferase
MSSNTSNLVIYNLGCGTRASPLCTNVDWSIHLRLRRWGLARLAGSRRDAIEALPETIVVHDLRRNIPAATASVDVVYHSHLLEHIDRSSVAAFMGEVFRVLRPGGIHRIVVPDLEALATRYLDGFGAKGHDERVARMIEQMVRREAAGSSRQPTPRRFMENVLLGDARRRGETHQWMYDRHSLAQLLIRSGFVGPQQVDYKESAIPGWTRIGLDRNSDGSPYKSLSLYMEAWKPD